MIKKTILLVISIAVCYFFLIPLEGYHQVRVQATMTYGDERFELSQEILCTRRHFGFFYYDRNVWWQQPMQKYLIREMPDQSNAGLALHGVCGSSRSPEPILTDVPVSPLWISSIMNPETMRLGFNNKIKDINGKKLLLIDRSVEISDSYINRIEAYWEALWHKYSREQPTENQERFDLFGGPIHRIDDQPSIWPVDDSPKKIEYLNYQINQHENKNNRFIVIPALCLKDSNDFNRGSLPDISRYKTSGTPYVTFSMDALDNVIPLARNDKKWIARTTATGSIDFVPLDAWFNWGKYRIDLPLVVEWLDQTLTLWPNDRIYDQETNKLYAFRSGKKPNITGLSSKLWDIQKIRCSKWIERQGSSQN